ncbi:MAG: HEAT repeat domain-containing protein [bacterium]
MQKHNSKNSRATYDTLDRAARLLKVKRFAGLPIILAVVFILPLLASQAQRLRVPVKLSTIAVEPSDGATTISIIADGSLARAQTWQDTEGYHIVLPNTVAVDSPSVPRGVRTRRVGTSLEILLQTKAGANVSLLNDGDRLQLTVDGKLYPRAVEVDRVFTSPEEQLLFENPRSRAQTSGENQPFQLSSTVTDFSPTPEQLATKPAQVATPAGNVNPATIVPNEGGPNPVTDPGPSQINVQSGDEGWMASIFSGTSVLIVFSLGLFGLLISRKMRSRAAVVAVSEELPASEEEAALDHASVPSSNGHGAAANTSLARIESGTNGSSHSAVVRLPAGPTSLYGAYRIDQEVGKLILGQAHRIDVLASRASDDRRAIETSLIKSVNSSDLDESARRRAREALEEYGFVARQCASLLLAPDAFERTSAARSLGDIKSPAALPFLLESLYDSESIVRNQAVVSIGELKIPSAIGALLDIARTHPDVPSALLSRTLSACSVEGLDFFDAVPEPGLLGSGQGNIVEEITHLEPASPVEDLPEGSDDPAFAEALVLLESDNADERAEAVKMLVQFPVQSSVGAITLVARNDSEPTVRSQAISGLAAINHESVFAGVLLGLSDDTREVRAAAARSLSRLSFDRADAYARLIESGDEETIKNVAKACIEAGIVSQNLDRLASSDHRQAYETFTLICLLARAKVNEPILNAIADHSNIDVRLKSVHLLACTGEPEIFEQLRELAVKDGMREDVKTALLEAIYSLDQGKLKHEETVEAELVQYEPVAQEAESELLGAYLEPNMQVDFDSEEQANLDEFES